MTTVHLYRVFLRHFFFNRKTSNSYVCLPRVAYVKGGEKERYNPLTGIRYERNQSHDANDPDKKLADQPSTSTFTAKRNRPSFFKRSDEASKWRGRGRAQSPYYRQGRILLNLVKESPLISKQTLKGSLRTNLSEQQTTA